MKIGILSRSNMQVGGTRTVSMAIEQTLVNAGYQVERYTPPSWLPRGFNLSLGVATARRALKTCDLLFYTDGLIGTPAHDRQVIVYEHGASLLESMYWMTEITAPVRPPRSLGSYLKRLPYFISSLGWRYHHATKSQIRDTMLNHEPLFIIANSQHTQSRLLCAGLRSDVICPPIDISYLTPPPDQIRNRSVVTVSRIVPDKQYESIINVVADSAPLHIVGSTIDAPQYARSLQERFPHVKYHYNASEAEKRSVLQKSAIYMHATLEDYGITIVEAMAAGCIPIVPDIGGHRETVPWPELRYKYQDFEEARVKLEAALSGKYDQYLPQIKKHVRCFDVSAFSGKILSVVRQLLAPPSPSK